MAKKVMFKDPSKDEVKSIHLPSPDTKRWVPRRKAMIVNAVHSGAMSLEEVCRCYELSVEEFVTWQRAIETHGIPGFASLDYRFIAMLPRLDRRSGGTQRRILRSYGSTFRIGNSHARAYCQR